MTCLCGSSEVTDPPDWPEAAKVASLHGPGMLPRDHSQDQYFALAAAGLCTGCGSLVLVYQPLERRGDL